MLQQGNQAIGAVVDVLEDPCPAQAATEEHQQWGDQSRQAAAREEMRPILQQADERQRENHILQPHGVEHVGAGTHQHCGQEIDQKGISEADPGIGRVFGREVVSLREARDDL